MVQAAESHMISEAAVSFAGDSSIIHNMAGVITPLDFPIATSTKSTSLPRIKTLQMQDAPSDISRGLCGLPKQERY